MRDVEVGRHSIRDRPGEHLSVARTLGDRLRRELEPTRTNLREDEQGLVVTHGGFPELSGALYASVEEADALGGPCRCLEGVWVLFVSDGSVRVQALRLPAERTRL
jgi:hypothetical protein